jgi:pre-mRNA-splicing factor RBM22/SLT11
LDVKDEQLKNQAIKDRYYGANDPVAAKILEKLPEHFDAIEDSSADKTVTTLVLFGNMETIKDHMIRPHFDSFGDIDHIRIISGSNCAFVSFKERIFAEGALEHYAKKTLSVNGNNYKVTWAKARKR